MAAMARPVPADYVGETMPRSPQPERPMSVSDLIDRLGGIRPLARELGLAKGSIQRWRENNYVPRRRLDEVRKLCRKRKIPVSDAQLLGVG